MQTDLMGQTPTARLQIDWLKKEPGKITHRQAGESAVDHPNHEPWRTHSCVPRGDSSRLLCVLSPGRVHESPEHRQECQAGIPCEFRVWGTEALYVVDGSVFPTSI